jgi:hypothetical protein
VTTRRQLILDSMVALLGAISTAAGYNTNVATVAGGGGAQKLGNPANAARLAPWLVVACESEDKREARHNYFEPTATYSVTCYVRDDGETPLDDLLEAILEDVERVLLTAKDADPPLGVAGAMDVHVEGHTKLPRDEEGFLIAALTARVQYRHDLRHPGTFTASP